MEKVLTKKEFAKLYGVSYGTFIKWLSTIHELKLTNGQRLLTPKQVKIIIDNLGEP